MRSTIILLILFHISSVEIEARPKHKDDQTKKDDNSELSSMYQLQPSLPISKREGRLQGVSIKGRLMCGKDPIVGGRVKIVDIDKSECLGEDLFNSIDLGPDKDDLMGDVQTGEDGHFHISGATREETDIEVMLKIYHDCLDGDRVRFTLHI